MLKLFSKNPVLAGIAFIAVFVISFLCFLLPKIEEYEDYSPTVIVVRHFFQEDGVRGEFTARYNNLGIISIKFDTYGMVHDDYLQFSIKEKGKTSWYYSNIYAVNQFSNSGFFPFGFPEIRDSRGKTYEIQTQLLDGRENNVLSISPKYNQFFSRYIFSKSYLSKNRQEIFPYVLDKATSYFHHVSIFSYLLIPVIFTVFFFLLKIKTIRDVFNYVFYGYSIAGHGRVKQPRYVDGTDAMYMFTFTSFLLLFATASLVLLMVGHTESSEWLIYIIGSAGIFFSLLVFLHPNIKIPYKFLRISLLTSFIVFFFLVMYLRYGIRVISNRYFILFALAGILPIVRFYKSHDPKDFLKTLCVNIALIFFVSAYFFSTIDAVPFWQFISVVFITLILTAFFLLFGKKKVFLIQHKIVVAVLLLLTGFFIFISTQKQIDYLHYYFFIGPAYEISQGKSIISDNPSQYGYLSIHFIETMLHPFGVNFHNFHLLNQLLYIGYFIGFFLIYRKITKNFIATIILSIITVSFQTQFSIYRIGLYPSTGPLRFGLGIAIILVLLYLPKKYSIFVSTIISSIALFWSAETAVYVIPAWFFAVGTYYYVNKKSLGKTIFSVVKNICLFILITCLTFVLIFVKEYRNHQMFPPLANYLQYVTAYQGGYGSLLMPLFGNYYICIAIVIVGFILVIGATYQKHNDDMLFPLSFLSIYNVAVFSYFVGRSHENNIINISPLFLLEMAMICVVFLKIKNAVRYYTVPFILFVIFFIAATYNNLTNKDTFQIEERYVQSAKNYEYLKEKYALNRHNVLVLSFYSDTLIIIENQIKTILPLNPSTMTMILPDYQKKYLVPHVASIPIGTTVVYANDYPELFEFIKNTYMLEEVDPGIDKGMFSVYIITGRK